MGRWLALNERPGTLAQLRTAWQGTSEALRSRLKTIGAAADVVGRGLW